MAENSRQGAFFVFAEITPGDTSTKAVSDAGERVTKFKSFRQGILFNRNRYYNPKVGRFTSRDPIGFNSGNNLWRYCNNNPVSYTDPFGQYAIPFPTIFIPGIGQATISAAGAIIVAGVVFKTAGEARGWIERASEDRCSSEGALRELECMLESPKITYVDPKLMPPGFQSPEECKISQKDFCAEQRAKFEQRCNDTGEGLPLWLRLLRMIFFINKS